MILKLGENRNDKTSSYSVLYSDFLKMNFARHYNYNSDNIFVKLPYRKIEITGLMKTKIRHRLKAINEKSKNVSKKSPFMINMFV